MSHRSYRPPSLTTGRVTPSRRNVIGFQRNPQIAWMLNGPLSNIENGSKFTGANLLCIIQLRYPFHEAGSRFGHWANTPLS